MLTIAWVRDKDDAAVKPAYRKPTRKEEVEALADHLLEKWERQDKIKAMEKRQKRLMSTSASAK